MAPGVMADFAASSSIFFFIASQLIPKFDSEEDLLSPEFMLPFVAIF